MPGWSNLWLKRMEGWPPMKGLNIEVGPSYDLGKRWEGTKVLGLDRDTEVLVELDLLA